MVTRITRCDRRMARQKIATARGIHHPYYLHFQSLEGATAPGSNDWKPAATLVAAAVQIQID